MHVVENKPHVNIMSSPVGTFSGSKRLTRQTVIKPEDLVIVSTVKGGFVCIVLLFSKPTYNSF